MTAAPAPNPGDTAVGLAFAAAIVVAILIVLGGLGGCSSPREVLVELPAPAPSVQTVTDTLFLASPPDTLFAPPDTVRVTETVPVEVVRYAEARPDTARAYRLWSLSVDSATVTIAGRGEDLRMAGPVPGERLVCVSRSPTRLECRVEGEPVGRTVAAPCPACPGPTLAERLRPWLYGLLGLLLGCCARFVLRSLLPSR